MARQRGGAKRGGGAGMFARKPAPKPAAPAAAPAKQAPPPAAAPAPAPAAPAPAAPAAAAPAAGGGMMSGLGGMVMQGMAMGTGSAIAHQAIGSLMGGGSSSSPAPAEAAAPAAAAQVQSAPAAASAADSGVCGNTKTDLFKCLGDNNNDANACQYYFDALRNCQENQQFAT